MHTNAVAQAGASNQYDPRAGEGLKRAENTKAAAESLLDHFRQRVDQETARAQFIAGRIRDMADANFGERPEKDGPDAAGPASGGRVGRMHESLNELERAIDALSAQLDRLASL